METRDLHRLVAGVHDFVSYVRPSEYDHVRLNIYMFFFDSTNSSTRYDIYRFAVFVVVQGQLATWRED
jgi:hypothetical protein